MIFGKHVNYYKFDISQLSNPLYLKEMWNAHFSKDAWRECKFIGKIYELKMTPINTCIERVDMKIYMDLNSTFQPPRIIPLQFVHNMGVGKEITECNKFLFNGDKYLKSNFKENFTELQHDLGNGEDIYIGGLRDRWSNDILTTEVHAQQFSHAGWCIGSPKDEYTYIVLLHVSLGIILGILLWGIKKYFFRK